MRAIFMGTPEFAVPCLRALVDRGHEVLLAVSQPDKAQGRGQRVQSPPVARVAREFGIEVAQPVALRTGPFPERFLAVHADVAVVVAYGRILPRRLLDAPRYGCVNVHASLLPRWRGAAPIQAAILAGDEVTGVCTQRMAEELDAGPIFRSSATPVDARETAGTLHDRLSALGADLLVETLEDLEHRVPVEQDPTRVTWAPRIERDSGRIDWSLAAVDLDRRVRAMTPWPGGHVPWEGGFLKLVRVRPTDGEGPPGVVLSLDPLVVACGEGALVLESVQAPGRKPVEGAAFSRGARLERDRLLPHQEVR